MQYTLTVAASYHTLRRLMCFYTVSPCIFLVAYTTASSTPQPIKAMPAQTAAETSPVALVSVEYTNSHVCSVHVQSGLSPALLPVTAK